MTKLAEPNLPSVFTQNTDDLRQFDKDLTVVLGGFFTNLMAILDGGVSFDDNLDISRVSVTSHVTPGTEFSVAHGLGKTPTGYIVYGQNAAGSIYDGATANDKTTLYLKSDVSAKIFRVMVF